jgi:transcriptional regulator MraZ
LFFGNFEHSLDPKSRVIIPARFRDALTKQGKSLDFFLTPGLDKCLFLFPPDQFDAIGAEIGASSLGKEEVRKFQRRFFGDANPVTADSMGRILIPESLKGRASIQRDVTIVGVRTRIEIWDRAMWQQHCRDTDDDYEKLASEVIR